MKEQINSIGRAIEPHLPALGGALQRGELGSVESNNQGFGLAIAAPFVKLYNSQSIVQVGALHGIDISLPEPKYENDQLVGATAGELLPLALLRKREANAIKNPSEEEILLHHAMAKRDALAQEYAKKKFQPATIVGAFNIRTRQTTAAANPGNGRGCAEDVCRVALGGNKSDIRFTRAVRVRTMRYVDTCQNCEKNYGRTSFVERLNSFSSDRAGYEENK